MSILNRVKIVGQELWSHSPFTLLGAAVGLLFMYLFKDISKENALRLFAVFHPLHVVLSAMVTAALFKLHRKASSFILILVIGYVGSIGVATLSDCILPYLGQSILGATIPTHAVLHTLNATDDTHDTGVESRAEAGHACLGDHDHDHEFSGDKPHLHIGLIEEWYWVNPAAILGVVLAYFWPKTKIPHAGHILISTWASASFMLMNSPEEMGVTMLVGMFIALFIAVWLPCCASDIIFPAMLACPDGVHLGHHGCVLCGHKDQDKGHGDDTHA